VTVGVAGALPAGTAEGAVGELPVGVDDGAATGGEQRYGEQREGSERIQVHAFLSGLEAALPNSPRHFLSMPVIFETIIATTR
jgi:hypothetical protein